MIALALLRRDGGTQPRASINHDAVVEIAAAVRQGTRRDAVLFSVGANASHGLRWTVLPLPRAPAARC